MARTKASVGAKVASGKSSKARCHVAAPPSSAGSSGSSDKGSRSYSGGNSVCHRETPKWQKAITNFFVCKDVRVAETKTSDNEEETAGSSKPKPKRNVIQSDDEDDQPTEGDSNKQTENKVEKEQSSSLPNGEKEKPTNHVLDETIELEPLTGEDSHKIEEYYPKNAKGKGVGKKTKGKENLDGNVERRNSVKRDLEDVTFGEESPHASKKVKVN